MCICFFHISLMIHVLHKMQGVIQVRYKYGLLMIKSRCAPGTAATILVPE